MRRYRTRGATAGSDRDAQGGWDGQHGWDLEPVRTAAPDAGRAARLLGLWAWGALVQTFIGAQVQHGPAEVRATTAEWTTTGRLSVGAPGQLALRAPSGRMRVWLDQILRAGAARVAAAPYPAVVGPPDTIPIPKKEDTGGQHRAA